MKMSEAIVRISKIYQPGAIEYFYKQNPDRWTDTLDWFESSLKVSDQKQREILTEQYFEKVYALIKEYTKVMRKPVKITPVDAFMMGEPRITQAISRIEKRCWYCDSKEDLTLRKTSDNNDLTVVCQRHKNCRLI